MVGIEVKRDREFFVIFRGNYGRVGNCIGVERCVFY